MNKRERTKFILGLIANVQKDALANVARMPDTWDGHEPRRYIADKFLDADDGFCSRRAWLVGRKRRRNYENTVLVENL